MKTNSKLTKRLLAVALAICMLCSVLVAGIGTGIIAKAASSYTAKLGYASSGWAVQEWNKYTTIDANGSYYITYSGSATGAEVFVVDIEGLAADFAVDAISVSNVGVSCDGVDLAVDQSKVIVHNEDNANNLRIEIYNAYGVGTAADPAIDMSQLTFSNELKVSFTIDGITFTEEEEPEEEEPVVTESDEPFTGEVPAEGAWADTDGSLDVSSIEYGFANTSDWSGSGVTAPNFTGWGTYTFVHHPANANWSTEFNLNQYYKVKGLMDALVESTGISDTDLIKEQLTFTVAAEIDGKTVTAPAFISVEGSDIAFQTWNPWAPNVEQQAKISVDSYIKVVMTINGPEITADIETPEEPEEELKGTTGKKKANGYIHDKGAIFVYTGDTYDIYDFNLATGWAFGKVHEINGKWGDSYFGEGGIAGVGTNEGTTIKGNGIYMKYWEDYRGIGYPAIQLSWDTDRIFYLGDITVYSNDWAIQQVFTVGDGFYRGPAERYEGTGEALLDGSNKWYYFGEGSYKAATEDTTTEDTATALSEGTVNVTGDGDIYAFVAIGADNTASDWAYSWAGLKPEEVDDANKIPAGITANAVNAKIGEQFTISVATETPVYYTWYVCPTIIVGAGKTVDAEVVAVRVDGKDVTNLIDFAAGDAWWYEDTGNYTEKNGNQAVRLAGGYNEWGTKYTGESPAGYSLIEYDVIINSIA